MNNWHPGPPELDSRLAAEFSRFIEQVLFYYWQDKIYVLIFLCCQQENFLYFLGQENIIIQKHIQNPGYTFSVALRRTLGMSHYSNCECSRMPRRGMWQSEEALPRLFSRKSMLLKTRSALIPSAALSTTIRSRALSTLIPSKIFCPKKSPKFLRFCRIGKSKNKSMNN